MRFFIAFLVSICSYTIILAQSIDSLDRYARIINTDFFEGVSSAGFDKRKLSGNVMIEHKDMYMECDSAMQYIADNIIQAYSNIHIIQQPCTHIWADSLHYDGDTRIVHLFGDVILTDERMQLSTSHLIYYMNTRIGTYIGGGVITQDGAMLTSDKGYYYGASDDLVFKKDVVLIHPDYQIYTDTLKYNIISKIAYFKGPTTIKNQEATIYCERGFYDTKNEYALFGRKTHLINPPQELYADTMSYSHKTGIGKAFRNVHWIDHENEMEIYSFQGVYNDKTGDIRASGNTLLTYVQDEKKLYLNADTIYSTIIDTTRKLRVLQAYHNVRIYRKDLQAVCDSIYYSFIDSTFRMYDEPYVWNDSIQLKGDTILLHTKNEKPSASHVLGDGFMLTRLADDGFYNQLKGDTIHAYFRNDALYKLHAIGSAESIYFIADSSGAYIGANQCQSDRIQINVIDNKVDKIVFIKQPKATFHAIQKINPKEMILPGCKWRDDLRPQSEKEMIDKYYE